MRRLLAWLGSLACAAGLACGGGERPVAGAPVASTGPLTVRAVGCVGLTVSNVNRLAEFYEHVLSFRDAGVTDLGGEAFASLEGIAGARARRRRLELGSECIELSEPLGGVRRSFPADSRSNDLWFQHIAIVVRDMDAAYARLEEAHVAHVSTAPQTLPAWNTSAANIRAYYFKDPDGHTLELIWFPADKGQARWHSAPGAAPFLGIDHTAIACHSTDASLAFYVGRLGMHVAGGSDNYGVEQEQLSGVPGAHVRITTLRASGGPGIELLQYLAPTDGRPAPADTRGDDLVHWRTVIIADAAPAVTSIRDPDGHVMEMSPQ